VKETPLVLRMLASQTNPTTMPKCLGSFFRASLFYGVSFTASECEGNAGQRDAFDSRSDQRIAQGCR
jgi:hypothetical protein